MSLQGEATDLFSFQSSKKQRTSGPGCKKHLYICWIPPRITPPPLWFSVDSVPVESLVDPAFPSSSCEEQVFFSKNEGEDVSHFTGFICLGDKLYSFSGMPREDQSQFIPMGREPWSSKAKCFDFSAVANYDSSVHPSTCKNAVTESHLKPMQSGKTFPIVAEIDGLIYVLAGPPFMFKYISDPFFEVYDPRHNSWQTLPGPPFLDQIWSSVEVRNDWDVEMDSYSYLVIEKKLCISTERVSFAFDTSSGKWEICELFHGFKHPENVSTNLKVGSYLKTSTEKWDTWQLFREFNHPDYVTCPWSLDLFGGPPFEFVRRGICYDEDILICVLKNWEPVVVAYQVDKSRVRVQKVQVLFVTGEDEYCDRLVDLGGGYISYQYTLKKTLNFLTFKVWKIGGGGDGSSSDFLQWEYLKTYNQKIKGKFAHTPVFSFAL